jgi:hypothetical protein
MQKGCIDKFFYNRPSCESLRQFITYLLIIAASSEKKRTAASPSGDTAGKLDEEKLYEEIESPAGDSATKLDEERLYEEISIGLVLTGVFF